MQGLALVLFMVFLCVEIHKLRHEWEKIFSLQVFNCK